MNSSDFFYLYLHITNQKTVNCCKPLYFLKSKLKSPEPLPTKEIEKGNAKKALILLAFSNLGCKFFNLHKNYHLNQLHSFKLLEASKASENSKTSFAQKPRLLECLGKISAIGSLKKYYKESLESFIKPYSGPQGPQEVNIQIFQGKKGKTTKQDLFGSSLNLSSILNQRIFSDSFKQNLLSYLSACQQKDLLTNSLLNTHSEPSQKSKGREGHHLDLIASAPLVDLFESKNSDPLPQPLSPGLSISPWLADGVLVLVSEDSNKKINLNLRLPAISANQPFHPTSKLVEPKDKDFIPRAFLSKFYTASWLLEFICTELGLPNSNIKRVLNQTFLLTQQKISRQPQGPQINSFHKGNSSKNLSLIPHLIKGLKVTFSGRMGGKKGMAKVLTKTLGRVPLSTLREKVDFAKGTVKTKVGSLGVKVWICYN